MAGSNISHPMQFEWSPQLRGIIPNCVILVYGASYWRAQRPPTALMPAIEYTRFAVYSRAWRFMHAAQYDLPFRPAGPDGWAGRRKVGRGDCPRLPRRLYASGVRPPCRWEMYGLHFRASPTRPLRLAATGCPPSPRTEITFGRSSGRRVAPCAWRRRNALPGQQLKWLIAGLHRVRRTPTGNAH